MRLEETEPGEAMGDLTTREAMDMIDDLVAIKSSMLVFSGGEPLLRDDIYELNVYAVKLGLSTNSTLIAKETAKEIKEAGFAHVGVSLDGTEDVHDSFRGGGAAGLLRNLFRGEVLHGGRG